MTEDKARKRAVRARMAKTGERYTAARRHVAKPAPLPPRVAEPGMSDAAVCKGTGRVWDEWFRILDAWSGTERSHREIARWLAAEHGLGGWWAQTVTVGYERARGMRAVHERPDGFSLSATKTVGVDVDTLSRAFTDSRLRDRWLEPGTLTVRTSRPGRSARFDFRDGVSRVSATFTSKGPARSSVSIQHERLPDAQAVTELRAFWKERLAALTELLP